MDPITIGLIATAVAGSATQIYGQRKARKAEIKALEQEAAFLEEQAKYTKQVGEKKELVLRKQAATLYGDQVNSFSKNNATLSGSVLDELVDTQREFAFEIEALREDVDFDVAIARAKAAAQREGARGLKKVGFLQDLGTGLTGASQIGSLLNSSISRTPKTSNKSTSSNSSGTLLTKSERRQNYAGNSMPIRDY